MAVNEEMNKIFQLVAEETGRAYTTLGIQLGVNNTIIQNIEDEYKRNEDRAYYVLVRWYQKNGQAGATREVLGKALEAIGKKSIAEKIGFYDDRREIKREDSAKDKQPIHTSIEKTNTKSNISSAYSFKLEASLSEELERILKYCTESIPTCNARELGHILKFLECVQALDEKMMKGTGSNEPNNDDPEIAKIKRTNWIRRTHTDQTIRLIKDQLLPKSRPVSEILHRCTSIIIPPQRSDTDSAVMLTRGHISSPISTTKSSRLLPSREMTGIECSNTEQVGEPQIIHRCPDCGDCFEQQTRVSENEEISLDRNCNLVINQIISIKSALISLCRQNFTVQHCCCLLGD